jgi:hypothetical protein
VNLEDIVGEEGLQQDEWSLSKPSFGEEGQLEVVGWSGRQGTGKLYIVKCNKCSQDAELFGGGYFKRTKSDLVNGQVPCGCSRRISWSKAQYIVRCKRKAKELGYTFLGFVGEWKGQKTKIKMLCEKHGEWSSGVIANLINVDQGCPGCKADTVAKAMTKPDDRMICSFLASGAFHPDTKFWRSDRPDSKGYKPYWYMSCPECGEIGESFSGDLQQGKRPCACSKQRQKEGYINFVMDNDILIAIKFGIAHNSDRRIKEQIRNNTLSITNKFIYLFPSVTSCKKAERECKQELQCGILSLVEMPDGYTETTWAYNLEKIIEIYKRNGGIRKENP